MFKIKWLFNLSVVTGLSTYSSIEKAQEQIDKWKKVFPNNRYFIYGVNHD